MAGQVLNWGGLKLSGPDRNSSKSSNHSNNSDDSNKHNMKITPIKLQSISSASSSNLVLRNRIHSVFVF